jgi:hypothetical protein
VRGRFGLLSATQLPGPRRPLVWGLGQRLPHLVLLLLFPLPLSLSLPLQAQQTVDDFGRWESEARRCQLGVAPGGAVWPEAVATLGSGRTPGPGLTSGRVTTMGCETVRLDQQLPGLLSVRFFSRGQGPGPSKRLLMFAGILERDSPPMACRSGRCGWASPMRTRVSALAELGLDELGQGATSLPTTRLVQGSCSIQPKRIRCQARMEGEGSWWAQVDL